MCTFTYTKHHQHHHLYIYINFDLRLYVTHFNGNKVGKKKKQPISFNLYAIRVIKKKNLKEIDGPVCR